MALIVQKFGGSSVADADKIRNVARIVTETYRMGHSVVVVLSAQGDTTDDLIEKAREIHPGASKREMDMLLATGEQISISLCAMAIERMGYQAISLTGWQAGMLTDSAYSNARIKRVRTERIQKELDKKKIVLVAGFQGINKYDDITTLGRGGSDTSAVALAAALHADLCQIYTDVDGVYTTDPRIAPRARKLDSICYDDMLELSSAGSGVLQSRAVEFARKWKVVIHSRSAFSDAPGTYVKEEYEMEEAVITGIASDTSEVKVTVRRVPDAPSVAAKVFSALAANNVNLDMIIQNVSESGFTDISYTTPAADLPRAIETMERIVPEIGAREFIVDEDIAKVSLVGTGMKSSPGVASRTFQTLGDNNINIMAISTSPIRLSMIVDAAQATQAVQCLHTAFGLDSDDLFVETQLSAEEIAAKMKKGR